MQTAIQGKIDTGSYDVFLLFEMAALQYFPAEVLHLTALHIEDPQSIKFNRMSTVPSVSFLQRFKWKLLAKLMRSYELRTLPRVGRVLLLSAVDVLDMRTQTGLSNIFHVPYGVERNNFSNLTDSSTRECAIVYSGNMFHSPNVDGGLFLLNQIFPLVLMDKPYAKLWIVGTNPDTRLVKAAQRYGQSVMFTGRVDDVSVYIRRAMVSVCPVRLKIGVQTKILEALCWGTPVVTTSAGNGGIEGISGEHLWVADDPRVLAQRICELLAGKGWLEMANAGKCLVTDRFTWSRSARLLEEQLEHLIQETS